MEFPTKPHGNPHQASPKWRMFNHLTPIESWLKLI